MLERTLAAIPPGPASDPEVDQLLHPSQFYRKPADVVADDLLTIGERRAILSSWASDACAVESSPMLRHPPLAQAPVTFDEIMDALFELDRMGTPHVSSGRHGRTMSQRRFADSG